MILKMCAVALAFAIILLTVVVIREAFGLPKQLKRIANALEKMASEKDHRKDEDFF